MILDSSKKLILDSDVVIHFTKGGRIDEIHKIFPNHCCMSDVVYFELRDLGFLTDVQPIIDAGEIELITISSDISLFSQYALIKKIIPGRGECASLAYCMVYGASLASSNVSDIHNYCNANDIQYVTTMDFVHYAYSTGKWTSADADYFIYNVKSKKSRLINGIDTIDRYKPRITGVI